MRVLLDENVDELLKGLFAPDFEVLTVRERGWQGKANGNLLRAAEREFDALVTMDRNLEYQQNLRALDLGIVVVRAHSNAYMVVSPLMPQVNEALRSVGPGQVVHVRSEPSNAGSGAGSGSGSRVSDDVPRSDC